MKKFYSIESAHGSESSRGFANDTIVKVFDSKSARDDFESKIAQYFMRRDKRQERNKGSDKLEFNAKSH